MTYYSREIQMPGTRKEGLCNYVQMVINRLEAEDYREALLTAVGLLDDLSGSVYDDVTDPPSADNMPMAEHFDALAKAKADAHREGFEAGQKAKAAELRRIFDAA